MSGGGGSIIEDLYQGVEDSVNEAFRDPIGTIGNAAVNISTLGTVGYKDGKFIDGVYTRALDEGIGEISGRNKGRDAIDQQKTALRDAKKAEEEEQETLIGRRRDQDILASRAAAIARRRGSLGLGGDGLQADLLGV